MRKLILSLLALVLSMALWPSLQIGAATEDFPAKYLPIVEVKVNIGNSQFEDDAFLQALIDALETRGVLVPKIDVGYAGTIDTDFSVTDPTNWNLFDHFGWWDEVGGETEYWDVFEAYLESYVTGYDSSTMYLYNFVFDLETSMLQLEYFDGAEYIVVDYKDLSGLVGRIETNPFDFRIDGWVSNLYDEAEALVEATPEAIALGIDDIDDMWYDETDETAYIGWTDDSDNDYHKTPFQAYEDYLKKTGFMESLQLSSISLYNEYGRFVMYDSVNEDDFYVRFSPVEYGGAVPTHYPSPDENPDSDDPADWTNDPHIVIHDDGQVVFYGYGAPAYKDFMLSVNDAVSDKHFSFDLDESKVDYHSMEGGGFLFSIALDDQETVSEDDDTMSGYSVLFTEVGTNLYRLTDVNVKAFHDTDYSQMEYVSGVELIQTGDKDTSSQLHAIKIDIVENVLSVMDNKVLAVDGVKLDVVGNRFGPLVSYASHGCSQLSWFVYDNLKMGTSISVVSKAQDNVGSIQWADGAFHVYINLEDTNDATLIVDDFVEALKADEATYIGIGLNASKPMHDAIVEGNDALGTYFGYDAYPQNLNDMATAIANYLWPLLEDPTIENIHNAVLDTTVISNLPTKPKVTIPGGVLDVYDELVAGHSVELPITINLLDSANVPTDDKALLDAYFQDLADKNAIGFYYLSISVEKWLDDAFDSVVTTTNKPITLVITIPGALRSMTSFKIVRVHNGVVSVIEPTYDAQKFTLTFTTDKFSTYAIQYADPDALPDTGDAGNLGWLFAMGGLLLLWLTKRPQVE
jgi:hypothetical protein